ncbi:MAG: hypothetical protein A2086_06570 [Spirochaetes bacterium GWD1_27_9]|nr:MAG: hypothetical protein A2Z98_01085 [Spirochaetes bacterium GWB1_27_13]OHD22285.1 MAG: hypothetical protein A2Y34_06170 [Spirochaetes bacterium GWC1_27_15]OHD37098.1 MAG: hypothetical protein A2086_06570 [Spirochaetes bacterium GWD1_27_9]
MKIIAIIGSPKGKGAGYKIVKMLEDRMKSIGKVEFEYLFLKNANLKPCIGCYKCMTMGEEKCPLKDDRSNIEQKLLEADGIILSSPVYVNNVSGLMKNFIDRFAYRNHRPCFHRQKVLSVGNMAGGGNKETLSALSVTLGGSYKVHELGISTPPWMQTERSIAKKERAIDIASKKFYQACIDKSLPSPTLYSYVTFLIMQKIYTEYKHIFPADYEFYNKKSYYFDTKINPIKVAVAKIIVKFMTSMMKDLLAGKVSWPPAKNEEE